MAKPFTKYNLVEQSGLVFGQSDVSNRVTAAARDITFIQELLTISTLN